MKTLSHLPLLLLTLALLSTGCTGKKERFIGETTKIAAAHTRNMLETAGAPTGKNSPRTMNKEGGLKTTGIRDWTSGFFPGSLWYLYELTGEAWWKEQAEIWTASQEPLKTYTGNHDIGFMMYCSYGNANRLDPHEEYKALLVESAHTLMTRYNDTLGVIKSWNGGSNWDRTVRWQYPVIIDNMMNLELLFYASKVTGDPQFYNAAVKHADNTLKNHIREDFTSYHVVDYDTLTGEAAGRHTAQGYSDNSTWARGQAWAVYGYTLMYRETKDSAYLKAAIKLADTFIRNLPEDLVPLWDFNVAEEGYTPGEKSYALTFREKLKDASAAAIVCSALFELGEYAPAKGYIDTGIRMLHSLASPAYLAPVGTNANFLIMHCVGSIPHKSEIDVPLVYADYYFLEALVRYNRLKI